MPTVIVGIGGGASRDSWTERALELSLATARASGADTVMLCGDMLDLPLYVPGRPLTPEATSLLDTIAHADGVIIASPAYHGTISGRVKNALDYLEELRCDSRPYLHGRAVGAIACGAGDVAPAHTLTTLRSVIHSLRGWPTPMGAALNTSSLNVDDALPFSVHATTQLELVGSQVASFARTFSTSARYAQTAAASPAAV